MSFDTLLAKSPSIIYKPGGVNGGLVVNTWAKVQEFIAFREGAVVVYVDDSIVSPALVPTASGITDCGGRVELRPARADFVTFAVLQIEPGATLRDLYKISAAVELRCNPQNATPSLSFTAINGGMYVSEGAVLSNAATATQPAVVVPANAVYVFDGSASAFFILNAPAVPLVSVVDPASTFVTLAFDATTVPDGLVSGPGGFFLTYDNSSASAFPIPGTPPAQAGLTGAYTPTNTDNIWARKPLDPITMGAPNVNDVPHFDGAKWVAGPVPATSTLSEQTIAASGVFAPTTVDVLVFVDTTGGAVNLTLPAPVAGVATRYTFKDSKQNFNVNAFTLVPPGAVLIEGANANFPVNAQGAHVTVISDGVNYFV